MEKGKGKFDPRKAFRGERQTRKSNQKKAEVFIEQRKV